MGLVDYSESEGSDQEEASTAQEPVKNRTNPNKPGFEKVVDRSNPHKIKVSLPKTPKKVTEDGGEELERPAKRARVSGGGLSGFNALLPAPKRAAAPGGGSLATSGRKGGLGSGVNLRTGVAPGFTREPEPTTASDEIDTSEGRAGALPDETVQDHGLISRPNDGSVQVLDSPTREGVKEEPTPKGKTTMFKPLSVARKPQKKKTSPTDGTGGLKSRIQTAQQPTATPKASLFSVGDTSEAPTNHSGTKGSYQPMVYSISEPKSIETAPDPQYEGVEGESSAIPTMTNTANQASQSLDTIASDLNLSVSAKRQLLGRQKNNPSAINIVNFNTDEEYKQNKLMRQAGELVQHNAVRAIAPGKHSLKQLVNAASTQKDALEESFASGRRNKKEAGSKYGW